MAQQNILLSNHGIANVLPSLSSIFCHFFPLSIFVVHKFSAGETLMAKAKRPDAELCPFTGLSLLLQ